MTAELVIHDPYPEMADWSYYLDVGTEKGEQKYSFSVIYVPHEVHPDYDDPEIGHDPDYLDGEGEDAQGKNSNTCFVQSARLLFWTFFGIKNQVELAKPWQDIFLSFLGKSWSFSGIP